MNETSHTPASTSGHSMGMPKKKSSAGKVILIIVAIVVLIGVSLFLGYWYRDKKAKEQADQFNQQISELQAAKQSADDNAAKIQAELEQLKNSKTTSTVGAPSATTKANVEAAIVSGNYAALQGTMTNPVKVVIAASGGAGDKTPAQAISEMNYIDAGTDPWTTTIPTATLTGWQSGPYKQYFPATAVVGMSANNYVISFSFDTNGKINTVFMTNNASLLAN